MSQIFTSDDLKPSKSCSKCGSSKARSEFYKDRTRRDGLTSSCKSCRARYAREHYLANQEKAARTSKAWYDANQEKVARQSKAWYEANRAKVARKQKAYYERLGKGLVYFIKSRWKGINSRTVNGSAPNWDSKSSRRYLGKGVRLEMTRDEFVAWATQRKELIEHLYDMSAEFDDGSLRPSIDRMDPDRHYSVDNIRLITLGANSSSTPGHYDPRVKGSD